GGGLAGRELHRAAVGHEAAGNELQRGGIRGGFGLNEHGFLRTSPVQGRRVRSLTSRWGRERHDQGAEKGFWSVIRGLGARFPSPRRRGEGKRLTTSHPRPDRSIRPR